MDTEALKDSWAQVAKSGDDVPLFFYSHLFLAHPEVRSMFPIAMDGQRDRFVAALGQIVSNVDALGSVEGYVKQLGRDHRRFSVVAEHYNVVGGSLLSTLRYFLGASWNEQLAEDWAAAYGLVAKIMVQAAEVSEDTTPPWWDGDVTGIERRTMDITVLTLVPRQRLDFQPGQSMAIEIPQRPRLWRYFSPANAPRADGSLEFHVQPVDGGQVSTAMARSLRVGDTVRLGAPIGDSLTLDSSTTDPLLMIAGGAGLAPLLAVLEQIEQGWQKSGSGPRVRLFHGVRMPWNLYARERLRDMAATHQWFDYTGVVSEDPSYPGVRGPVADPAAEVVAGGMALVCGSDEMVSYTTSKLVSAGLTREAIRCEKFSSADSFAASSSTGDHS